MVKPLVDLQDFKPEFEASFSHLDQKDSVAKPILLYQKPLITGQFDQELHPVIYPSGLIMLNPRWTADTYNIFYSKYYDSLYDLAIKPDYGKEGIIKNMHEVWKRVESNMNLKESAIKSVLDAGCGPGYGLEYLKELMPQIELYGIEASPDARDVLEMNVGATIIDSDIDGDWYLNNTKAFDVIILRHVVEHMLTPVKSLSNLRKTLSDEGFIYIAVPDMMRPRTILRDYDDWWEYWFRSVHAYYYCKETLFATLNLAGLEPIFFGEENEEVWCIAKAMDVHNPNNHSLSEVDVYDKQMKVLNTFLPK